MKTRITRLDASSLCRFSACVITAAALLPSCTLSNDNAGGGEELTVTRLRDTPSERSAELFRQPGENLLASLQEVEAADNDVFPLNNSVLGALLTEAGAYFSAATRFQPGGTAYRAETEQCRSSVLPDAVDVICQNLAEGEVQLLFIDETPHFAHDRVFGRKLLECARAAGFQYFVVQALEEDPAALIQRGYVSKSASGPYLREPQFAGLVDDAIRLEYTPIRISSQPLCADCSPIEAFGANIEADADSLIAQTFEVDPAAKVLVWTGPAQSYEQPWGQRPFKDSIASLVFAKTDIEPYALIQVTMDPATVLGPPPPSGIYLASGPQNGSCSGSYSPGSATGLPTHDGVIVHIPPRGNAQGSDAERWDWLHAAPENRMSVTPECTTCTADQRLLVQAFPPGVDIADRVATDQALCQAGVACQLALPPGDYQLVVWSDTEQLASTQVTLAAGTPAIVTMN